ncbi:MAG: GntR family transcriptional regulator [Planctomycetota bacterium]|nr:MAG: GntR family transcriptional regulator [Planctomycetota bacterium]
MQDHQAHNQAQRVYEAVRQNIFDFAMLPGERFTEGEIAEHVGVSRTPVREALYRLQQEGLVLVLFRSGWQVRPFDFTYYDELYDLRILLENSAVQRLARNPQRHELLADLCRVWPARVPRGGRDPQMVADRDEAFHHDLVAACGNAEMSRVHQDITNRLRIIRRLDFSQAQRITATYREHAAILQHILSGKGNAAAEAMSKHISTSAEAVRSITLHRLHQAQAQFAQSRTSVP